MKKTQCYKNRSSSKSPVTHSAEIPNIWSPLESSMLAGNFLYSFHLPLCFRLTMELWSRWQWSLSLLTKYPLPKIGWYYLRELSLFCESTASYQSWLYSKSSCNLILLSLLVGWPPLTNCISSVFCFCFSALNLESSSKNPSVSLLISASHVICDCTFNSRTPTAIITKKLLFYEY